MAYGTQQVAETLQSAVSATGNGTVIEMEGYSKLAVQVTGTFTGTVTFEGTLDDSNWVAVGLKTAADGAAVTSTTGTGLWKLPADGPILSQFRARVTWTSGTSVTVTSLKHP